MKELTGPEVIRKHLAHDLKFLAFAAAQFSRPENEFFVVPLQDSALVRARSVIDFFRRDGDTKDNYRSSSYYEPGVTRDPLPPLADAWFKFISARLSHQGKKREPDEGHEGEDTWPDRAPGEDKGEDRLVRLARFVVCLIRTRAMYLTEDCRTLLREMADRAEGYLVDPSEDQFHRMDPSNI